nr:MAG TPA: hypothetical protein [Caudoviricetes sp.]
MCYSCLLPPYSIYNISLYLLNFAYSEYWKQVINMNKEVIS